MSKIENIVGSLEEKSKVVLNRQQNLEQKNQDLKKKLQLFQKMSDNQEQEITAWKDKHETLKVANALHGSDMNKKETKLKINTLIREIDHCISQLSE